MILLGLDPGLRSTGWGVIAAEGNRLRHVANGRVTSETSPSLSQRLVQLYQGLEGIIAQHRPDAAAVEETFVNANPATTLKLGQARAVALLVPALAGVPVSEYAANLVKKSVVGTGHAGKQQIRMMVQTLLPGCRIDSEDAADALAVAICHAHHVESLGRWARAGGGVEQAS